MFYNMLFSLIIYLDVKSFLLYYPCFIKILIIIEIYKKTEFIEIVKELEDGK